MVVVINQIKCDWGNVPGTFSGDGFDECTR